MASTATKTKSRSVKKTPAPKPTDGVDKAAVSQATDTLKEHKELLKTAKAEARECKKAVTFWNRELNKREKLFEKANSPESRKVTRAERTAAKAELKEANKNLKASERKVKEMETNVSKAQNLLDRAKGKIVKGRPPVL